jgi:prepilin-type N-terminal cleavage/methylation domain-containing protein
MRKGKLRQGFTLLELVVVFVILGVLSTIAMTSLSGRIGNYQLTQAAEIIGRVDAHARRQASRQRQPVSTSVARLANLLRVSTPQDLETRSFRLPNGVSIGETKFRQQIVATTDFDIRYNRYGISPSYAMKLNRGSQSRWIIVLGASGQIIQTNEAEEVNEILAL